jgi:ABC-type transporter Mla MlaB component
MMPARDFAFAVRPGEHACCRVAHGEDRDRLDAAFVCDGLRRGHMVVCLCAGCDVDETLARLLAADRSIDAAVARGQVVVRDTAAGPLAGSVSDVERMLETVLGAHARALAEGYTGLSLTGDIGAGLSSADAEGVAEYERRLESALAGGTQVLLCRYDDAVDAGTLSHLVAAHHVDVSPELATIGRRGLLAAARVHPPETLRLAGELDFDSADDLSVLLDEHFQAPRRLDLADLSFVDVSGMRALRGNADQPLAIAGASEPVRCLVELLGWDTDPAVEVAA